MDVVVVVDENVDEGEEGVVVSEEERRWGVRMIEGGSVVLSVQNHSFPSFCNSKYTEC